MRFKEVEQGRKSTAVVPLSDVPHAATFEGCFLLPTVTVCHLIGMPRDHFHTRPADVIFFDA